MDTFSLWMIIIYIVVFICNSYNRLFNYDLVNLIFLIFDIYVKVLLLNKTPEGCDYIDILEDNDFITIRVLKSVNQALNFCEHQAFIIGFNFFVFKLYCW